MKLTPITTTTEPSYPTYRSTSPAWKKVAAAVAASAALWLPACGDEIRLAGAESPPPAGWQPQPVQQPPQPEAKPPEPSQPPVVPEPEPTLAGVVASPIPPPPAEPPPVRLAGRARSPEAPK